MIDGDSQPLQMARHDENSLLHSNKTMKELNEMEEQIHNIIRENVEAWKLQGRDPHDIWAMENWLSGQGQKLPLQLVAYMDRMARQAVNDDRKRILDGLSQFKDYEKGIESLINELQ